MGSCEVVDVSFLFSFSLGSFLNLSIPYSTNVYRASATLSGGTPYNHTTKTTPILGVLNDVFLLYQTNVKLKVTIQYLFHIRTRIDNEVHSVLRSTRKKKSVVNLRHRTAVARVGEYTR